MALCETTIYRVCAPDAALYKIMTGNILVPQALPIPGNFLQENNSSSALQSAERCLPHTGGNRMDLVFAELCVAATQRYQTVADGLASEQPTRRYRCCRIPASPLRSTS